MKILWFANIPVGLDDYYGIQNKSGFWLSSLASYLKGEVELHIAFYYSKHCGYFIHNDIHYHPMRYEKYLKVAIKNKFNIGTVDCDDLNNYLSIINKIKPDLIHIHGTENIFTCLLNNTEIPVVVSIQGILSTISKRMYDGINEKYYKNTRKYLSKFIDIISLNLLQVSIDSMDKGASRERKNLKDCKNIIGRTDWDRRTASILAAHAQYYHIDEIMRPEFFQIKWKKTPKSDSFTVFSIASNAPYKGFELICDTLDELTLFNKDVIWQVAGILPNDPVVAHTKKRMKGKFPQDNLRLLGYLPTKDLIGAMLASDVYVMPSHIENGCNALSEAMLLGMPCISCFSGGVGTTITNNIDGILLQCGDSLALAGAVLELKNDLNKAMRYGKEASIKAHTRHDPKEILNKTLGVYREIIAK